MKYPSPKGVFDILPKDPTAGGEWRWVHLWHYMEDKIHELAKAYGYREIRTPIFERTELFIRGVGESSDIVSKEMYNFEDKGERWMTLRPEGTAPVIRAYVENRLDQHIECQKLYYIGPMFRYDRPQAGRYRQFHHFGVEAIGDSSPEQDVEVIDLLCELYRRLGLKDLTVMLNSVGDTETRDHYKAALRIFLSPKFGELSEDSKIRFEKNVLRILDSKDPRDQKALERAPSIFDFFTEDTRDHFAKVQFLLKKIGIRYELNSKLVRGLDYYTKTVFEVTAGELGSQNAISAGGRYDGLISLLGGPDLPSVGFAAGLERILQTMLGQKAPFPQPPHPDLFLIPLGSTAKEYCIDLVYFLRHQNIATEIDWHPKKVGKSLEHAVALRSTYALILGDDELASHLIKLKKLSTREEFSIPLDHLSKFLLGQETSSGLNS